MSEGINILVTSQNEDEANLVARLVHSNLNANGFTNVVNVAHPGHSTEEEEVVDAMRGLYPGIFDQEVTIEASAFEESGLTDEVIEGADIPLVEDD